ncbi:hypothetical protein JR316_0010364 [Psilocybe cubensis]|uniref:Uncharacterized protein n=2 Tax=Psilocybe cubensis TaxID=181762 RepID=A0ACB8GM24_PSICU|nr:hypothetical protein JR316_0010364 [Psilocybe cubensis]KAH9476452.1 hypothetical protein JR316_0010364 [Psilocybe cubensis]
MPASADTEKSSLALLRNFMSQLTVCTVPTVTLSKVLTIVDKWYALHLEKMSYGGIEDSRMLSGGLFNKNVTHSAPLRLRNIFGRPLDYIKILAELVITEFGVWDIAQYVFFFFNTTVTTKHPVHKSYNSSIALDIVTTVGKARKL